MLVRDRIQREFIPFLMMLLLPFSIRSVSSISNRTSPLRALWNLNSMAECKLHYTALVYDDYGCWCGIGGSHTPIDGIDECCMAHDKCYDAAVDNGICYDTEIEYVDSYSWSCIDEEPTCPEIEQQAGCKGALCQCDKHLVDCWSGFQKPTVKKKCTHQLLEEKPTSGQINVTFNRLIALISSLLLIFYAIF